MKTKAKKRAAFYKKRGSYLPSSPKGFGIYCLYLAYIVALPIAWYQHGHELWTLLAIVIPLWAVAAVFTQYIASKNAR
jgi:hypothetical protein